MLLGSFFLVGLIPQVVAQELVHEEVTADGLRIWSFPDDGGDRFVMMVLVGAGARHEQDSQAGLAHLLEHVLLGSTREWTRAKSRERLDEFGASDNGYTSHDVTTYFLSCPAASWSSAVDWLAAHLVDPAFNDVDLEIERKVVFEELDSNQPHAGGSTIGSFLYPDHALGRLIGGDKARIGGFQMEDLRGFYKEFYQAKNMAVGFAGKVPREDCMKRIASAFGGLEPYGGLASIEPVTPLTGDVRLPDDPYGSAWIYSGYHLPTSNAVDTAAQILIANYLDLRAFQVIREEHQLAYAPEFELRFFSDTTCLSLDVEVSSRQSASEVFEIEQALYAELSTPIEATLESARRRSAVLLDVNSTGELGEAMEISWLMRRAGESPMDLQRALVATQPDDLAAYAAAQLIPSNRFVMANAPFGGTPWIALPLVLLFLFLLVDGVRGFVWINALRWNWTLRRNSRLRRKRAVVPIEGDELEKRFQAFFDEEDGGH